MQGFQLYPPPPNDIMYIEKKHKNNVSYLSLLSVNTQTVQLPKQYCWY